MYEKNYLFPTLEGNIQFSAPKIVWKVSNSRILKMELNRIEIKPNTRILFFRSLRTLQKFHKNRP